MKSLTETPARPSPSRARLSSASALSGVVPDIFAIFALREASSEVPALAESSS